MKKTLAASVVVILLILISSGLAFAQYANTYPHRNECPQLADTKDDWNFLKCECTSYVAWKLNELWDIMNMEDPTFTNKYLSDKRWSDAKNWKERALAAGIYVDNNPLPGDVAWWGNGIYGHVAFVEMVNPDGSVDISEYNAVPPFGHVFSVRRNVTNIDAFLHIHLHHEYCYEQSALCPGFPDVTDGSYSDGKGAYVAPDPPSSSKPDLFIKEIKFEDEKTKYYSDEDVKLIVTVKNVGASVSTSIEKIKLEYIRCKGEKCNGDEKVIDTDNVKGENLYSGATKNESIEFGSPSNEGRYIYYACIDTKNVVKESNEGNNCSGQIWMRVHDRPDFVLKSLTMDGGKNQYSPNDIAYVKAVTENRGGEPFIDVRVGYYLDNALIEDDNIRHWNLEKGDKKSEDMYLVIPGPGTHILKACADHNQAVKETDETNNCASVVFEVADPTIPGYEFTTLLPNGWEISFANGINDSGQVVGHGIDASGQTRSFIYNSVDRTYTMPGSWPFAQADGMPLAIVKTINDSGLVAGEFYDDNAGFWKGFLYDGNETTNLLPPGWTASYASEINDSGQVAGYGYGIFGQLSGFLYTNGSFITMLPVGFTQVKAAGINDSGQVVVHGFNSLNQNQSFLYNSNDGSYSLPEGWPFALTGMPVLTGINDNGQLLGHVYTGSSDDYAMIEFIYNYNNETLTLLQFLNDLGLSFASFNFNDSGQIVATYYDVSGTPRGCLLTPQ